MGAPAFWRANSAGIRCRKTRIPRGMRVFLLAALACWAVGALVFGALPPGSAGHYVAANAVYFAASALVLVSVARAIWNASGGERLFWSLLGAGLIAGFVGDMGWSSLQGPGFAAQDLSYQHVA